MLKRRWRGLFWRAFRESTDVHVVMALALWFVLVLAFYLAVSQ